MNESIKNFIEESEKEFNSMFVFETTGNVVNSHKHIKRWFSSRQISLIKMIVEMCEENAEDMVLDSGADLKLIKLDTISSKLKTITDGK